MELKNKIYLGDCVDIMKDIPSESISGCITDPPYNYEFVGRNWDKNEIERRKSRVKDSSSTLVKNLPYGSGLAGGVRNAAWYKKKGNLWSFMVKLKNITKIDNFISCDYYPEGEIECGFFKIDIKNNFDIVEHVVAPYVKDWIFNPYFHRAKNRLIKIVNDNPLPKEQLVMWY